MQSTFTRLRRLRGSPELVDLVRESRLSVRDFVFPLFVIHGRGKRIPVDPMPGIYQISVDRLASEVKEIRGLGIPAVLLFGIPEHKDSLGTEGVGVDGIIQRAIAEIKSAAPDMVVITDVCLCDYTDHGHCGCLLYTSDAADE